MLHGSGPEERSANRYLAEQLASQGVAVLIYDKRGTGTSSGDWQTSTFADLAADAEAGVNWVRKHQGIDSRLVGLYGHSQGAMIGPMIASRSHHVAFFVASAAAGVALEEVERYSVENAFGIRQLPPSQAIEASEYVRALVHTAYTGRDRALLDSLVRADSAKPWFRAPPASDNYYWKFARRCLLPEIDHAGFACFPMPTTACGSRRAPASRSGGRRTPTGISVPS
jgi:predicted acyl esterase